MWLNTWGEHLHHGYYSFPNYKDHKQAQITMIDEALRFGYGIQNISNLSIRRLLDVGCGVGGSSRYIANLVGCQGHGISLSQRQVLIILLNLNSSLKFNFRINLYLRYTVYATTVLAF
jgi:tocopherol O-methyltransferase